MYSIQYTYIQYQYSSSLTPYSYYSSTLLTYYKGHASWHARETADMLAEQDRTPKLL